jgi:hypothetical protein
MKLESLLQEKRSEILEIAARHDAYNVRAVKKNDFFFTFA